MEVKDLMDLLSERLDRIEGRQEKQTGELVEIKVGLAEHMRRTSILEEELAPIKTHVAAWGGVSKAITILGTLGGLAVGIWKLFL